MRRWLFALALLSACGKNEKPPPPSNVSFTQESGPGGSKQAGPPRQALEFFARTCVMCHGQDGTGTGPASATLNPKPRNYTDPAWQASITDEQIKKIIVLGGQGVGKSPSMPPNPDLQDDKAMLDGLVKIIRGFGKK